MTFHSPLIEPAEESECIHVLPSALSPYPQCLGPLVLHTAALRLTGRKKKKAGLKEDRDGTKIILGEQATSVLFFVSFLFSGLLCLMGKKKKKKDQAHKNRKATRLSPFSMLLRIYNKNKSHSLLSTQHICYTLKILQNNPGRIASIININGLSFFFSSSGI
jgi:hypothetical protein